MKNVSWFKIFLRPYSVNMRGYIFIFSVCPFFAKLCGELMEHKGRAINMSSQSPNLSFPLLIKYNTVKKNSRFRECYACFGFGTKTGVVRILVILQHRSMFSHISEKLSPSPLK